MSYINPVHPDPIPVHPELAPGKVITFKCRISYCNYVTRLGEVINFVGGEFSTKRADIIAELKYEINKGHEKIYEWVERVESDLDPMSALKAKFFAEFQKDQAAATLDPDRDMGTSEAKSVIPASSRDVAAASAGGSGSQLAQQLANLKVGSEPKLTPAKS